MPNVVWDRSVDGLMESWSVNSNGVESPHSTTIRPISRDYGVKDWVRPPGYSTKLRLFQLPMIAYTFRRTREKYVANGEDSTLVYRRDPVRIDFQYHHKGAVNTVGSYEIRGPTLEQIFSLEAKAMTASRLAIKNQKVNIGQVFGERRQTVRLFEDTARRIVDAVVAVKHGSFNKAAKALGVAGSAVKHRKLIRDLDKNPAKAIAKAWLELQYGWKPLLDDVYGSAEAVAKADLRQVGEMSSKKTSVSESWTENRSDNATYDWENKGTWKYSIKYVVYFTVPNENIKTLSELGIINPVSVAWELVPFSFVVDWFLPIGNWINSWDATSGLVFQKGSKTVAWECDSASNIRGRVDEGNWYGFTEYVRSGNGSLQFIYINRSALSGWPSISVPQIKNPFSGQHIANLLALLTVSFKTPYKR